MIIALLLGIALVARPDQTAAAVAQCRSGGGAFVSAELPDEDPLVVLSLLVSRLVGLRRARSLA